MNKALERPSYLFHNGIMLYTSFPGQMQGERILHCIAPHPISEFIGYLVVGLGYILILFIFLSLAQIVPGIASGLQILGIVLSFAAGVYGFLCVRKKARETVTFITDLRIIAFRVISLKATAKSFMYWKDAKSVQSFTPNGFWSVMGIASLQILPVQTHGQTMTVTHVENSADLVDYMNALIAASKAVPARTQILPFDLLPKGHKSFHV